MNFIKMKIRLRTTITTIFFLTIPFYSFAQNIVNIDSFIIKKYNEKNIPGIAFAIIKNGQVVKKSFYGKSNVEQGTTVNEHTVFEIASMTKQFTCAAILLLQQEGKLSLSDKLLKYIPDLPKEWNSITLYHLMNHTSGLRDDWNEPTSYFMENNSDEKMIKAQEKSKLYFQPGDGFNYSSGPFFLGVVIEKITGLHYSHYIQSHIFNPLQMDCSFVYNDTAIIPNRGAGYWWKNNKLQNGVDIPSSAESRADVGILTCLDDMIKWSAALNDTVLLSKKSLIKMFTPGRLNNGNNVPYSLGWFIYPFRGKIMYEHGGAFRTGFNSSIIFFPEENVQIVILCNLWKAGLDDIAYDLASYYITDFKKVSSLKTQTGNSIKLTNTFEELFRKLAHNFYLRGDLYKMVNFSGYDTDDLADLLKGFTSLQYIEKIDLASKPLKLYDKEINKIYYYKTIADKTTYWSFYMTSTNELISVNLED